jgi:hypothetical protein
VMIGLMASLRAACTARGILLAALVHKVRATLSGLRRLGRPAADEEEPHFSPAGRINWRKHLGPGPELRSNGSINKSDRNRVNPH